METIAYIAMTLFVFWLSAELDKAQPATQEPAVQVTEAIAEQPAIEDPWEEPTNAIKFPTFALTTVHTFNTLETYEAMTIRELKAIGKQRKLKNYSRMTKTTLIEQLAA